MQWSINVVKALKTKFNIEATLSNQAKSQLDTLSLTRQLSNNFNNEELINELKSPTSFNRIENLDDRKYYNQLITLLEQNISFRRVKGSIEKSRIRDICMANNVKSIVDSLDAKCIIWAHNEHLVKTTNIFNYESMGYWINKQYGAKYYCIGFFMKEGSLGYQHILSGKIIQQKIPSSNNKKSIGNVFAQLKYDNFFLSIKNYESNLQSQPNFFNNKVIYRNVTLTYSSKKYRIYNVSGSSKMNEGYDGIIYIKKTTGAIPIIFDLKE